MDQNEAQIISLLLGAHREAKRFLGKTVEYYSDKSIEESIFTLVKGKTPYLIGTKNTIHIKKNG